MESDPEPVPITVILISIAVLIAIHAFLVCSEVSIRFLNKSKTKFSYQENSKKVKLLVKIIEEPRNFILTLRCGIIFVSLFSSVIVTEGVLPIFRSTLNKINIPYMGQISLVTITIGLTYIILIFGELFPKRIANRREEDVALFSVLPVYLLFKILGPFVKLITLSIDALAKITGFKKSGLDEKVSEDDIKTLVEVGQEHGIINETEKEMIEGIFKFDDKLAKEVMTPRTEVFLININDDISVFLNRLLEEKYSRVPVYDGDVDNIIGILYMKDFMIEAYKNGFRHVDISKILHPPYFVHESKNIDVLFKEVKTSKNHIAIVIDEYGGFSGVVTIEDLIEEVMGDILDEYDDDEPDIRKIDTNTYIVRGLLPLDELNEHLDLNLECESYDTIGGFLINMMGRIPKKDEDKIIEYDNVIFKIEEVKERRIEKVKILIS